MFTVLLTDVDIGLKCDTKEILVFLDLGNLLGFNINFRHCNKVIV